MISTILGSTMDDRYVFVTRIHVKKRLRKNTFMVIKE